jgi:hypothetical protein
VSCSKLSKKDVSNSPYSWSHCVTMKSMPLLTAITIALHTSVLNQTLHSIKYLAIVPQLLVTVWFVKVNYIRWNIYVFKHQWQLSALNYYSVGTSSPHILIIPSTQTGTTVNWFFKKFQKKIHWRKYKGKLITRVTLRSSSILTKQEDMQQEIKCKKYRRV